MMNPTTVVIKTVDEGRQIEIEVVARKNPGNIVPVLRYLVEHEIDFICTFTPGLIPIHERPAMVN